MRVLIIPMSAMAETAGSFSRTILLTDALKEANIDTAVCFAKDVNYKPINHVKCYFLSVPMPLGLPKIIATHTFPMARKLGITNRKSVNSFDEVLHLTGNTDYKYLKNNVSDIRNAIQDFNPNVIYSEFNISAIIAGKIEKKKIFITASFPTQYTYANTPRYACGLNRLLKEYGFAPVKSCLDLFSWADKKFVPSCYELEPFQNKNVIFCGTWKRISPAISKNRNKILVYMGNGTISQKKMVREISAAFRNVGFSVYIAGKGLQKRCFDNIQTAPYFDFNQLLPQSVLYINHGGQNSVIDGLIYGVPQLICAGKVFERRYNAGSIVKIGAGLEIPYKAFTGRNIKAAADKIISENKYRENALKIGNVLLSQGGTENIIHSLEKCL